tara:strand:+ start:5895 stop:7001 length:1107 start_codon:yes stop_codon:yes gene_type:complete
MAEKNHEKIIRKIIHIDMDAYYASVEQLDNVRLRGKPVVVGGSSERGVVAAASYEARKYGIKSAMSSVLAKKKCRNIIFVKPRFKRYKNISGKIRSIFYDYTDLVEPLSLDEAFLDVTQNKKGMSYATNIAREIRLRIKTEIGLTASAGISINKFIAKVATEINKPNGQKTIHPSKVDAFIESLPIDKFYGIGRVTSNKMNALGIFNGLDLKNFDKSGLINHFGKSGEYFYKIVRSTHDNPVNPNRTRKSIGAEQTFSEDIRTESFMLDKLSNIADELEKRMIKSHSKGKTITIKIKYNDFTQQTCSKTIDKYISKKDEFFPVLEKLLYKKKFNKSVRLLGISITNLLNDDRLPQKSIEVQLKFDFNT